MKLQEEQLLAEGLHALKRACLKSHKGGPGGSAICICGAACGGSSACRAQSAIKTILIYSKSDNPNVEKERQLIRDML